MSKRGAQSFNQWLEECFNTSATPLDREHPLAQLYDCLSFKAQYAAKDSDLWKVQGGDAPYTEQGSPGNLASLFC